jgi:hypothetical protein
VTCAALTIWNVTAAVPLSETEVAPVRFVPLTVTLVPAGPLVGVKLEMLGAVFGAGLAADPLPEAPPPQPQKITAAQKRLAAVSEPRLIRATEIPGAAEIRYFPVLRTPIASLPPRQCLAQRAKSARLGVLLSARKTSRGFSWRERILLGIKRGTCPNGQFPGSRPGEETTNLQSRSKAGISLCR